MGPKSPSPGMPETLAPDQLAATLATCPVCGLAQSIPPIPERMRACCGRCGTTVRRRSRHFRSNRRSAALAAAGLILYPLAIGLPLIRVEKFGHHNDASILEGTATLLTQGHVLVALIVGLCSVVLPLGKLGALLILSAGGLHLRHHHRALTYHLVEWTGRWGMLDVLLVAVLVAVLKLGDVVDVSAGPAALAFTSCVVLSLLASAFFDPHSLWSSAGSLDE